jgi:hypothetical protein
MSNGHLSELALERLLLGIDPAGSPAAAHLAACGPCEARLAEMRREGEAFAQYVFPATVDAVEAAAAVADDAPLARRLVRLLAPFSALAAAAAVFLLVQPGTGPSGPAWDGVKGEHGLGLSVFLEGAAAPVHVAREGERVSPAAALRFRVQPTAPCHLWLVSVDAAGQVSRLFPTGGDEGALVAARFEVPGGALLDGRPGPERVVALCTPGPIHYATVERAVQVAVARGEPAVRSVRVVPGLPAGTAQASVLLEKGP